MAGGSEGAWADPVADARALRRRERLLLAVLTAVQFCHIMDFVILMPLGPQLMRSLDVGPRQFGLLVSAYTFSAAVSGLLAAFLADRFDRKAMLLVLLAGFGVGTLLCGLAPSYPLLLAARVAAGAFGGVLAGVVMAVIGDQIPAERRGAATGIVMAGFSAASVLGLPAGLWVAARWSWHWPFLLLAGVTAGVLLFGLLALPPMRAHVAAEREGSGVRQLLGVMREPVHVRAFVFTTALLVAGFSVAPFLSPYLVANVGIGETDLSLVYLFGGLATLVSGPLIGRMADRRGHARVFTVVTLLTLLPVVAITVLPRVPLWQVLVVTTLMMVLASGRMITAMALLTGVVEPRRRGSFMSVNSSVQQVSAGAASFVAGLLVAEGPGGRIEGFWHVGVLAVAATFVCLLLLRPLVAAQVARDAGPHPAALEPPPSSTATFYYGAWERER